MSHLLGKELAEPIPFVRPALPDLSDLSDEIAEIFSTGMLTKGRFLREFKARLAEHLQVRHAVCVSSCTSGLMLLYRAAKLEGEVIVPSFTFMATVSSMVWCGLRPVYVDVDAGTTNINPELIEPLITPRTSAIVAVHNFGNPAEVAALESLARRHGLKLLFDAAHGFGSSCRGRPLGGQGDAHVFSLSPTKLLVAGEGGVVATDDDAIAEGIRTGREYGNNGSYDSQFAGMNARMPELSALVGLRSLAQLDQVAAHRRALAARYGELLGDLPGVELMRVEPGNLCSYKDFSIVIDRRQFGVGRDELARRLAERGIDTRKYYDPPVHRQLAYRHFCDERTHLPVTERLAAGSLSVPMGPHVDDERIALVAGEVREIHSQPGSDPRPVQS